jgi:hypothetical protein
MPTTNVLKRRLKVGPRTSRRLLGEFALCLANSPARPARQLTPQTLGKIKSELVRLANNGNCQSFEFVERMFQRYPELRGA